MMALKEWLKKVRLEKYGTQSAVAEAAGISVQMYNFIECGARQPSVRTAKRIADVLGFDWQLFFPDERGNQAG